MTMPPLSLTPELFLTFTAALSTFLQAKISSCTRSFSGNFDLGCSWKKKGKELYWLQQQSLAPCFPSPAYHCRNLFSSWSDWGLFSQTVSHPFWLSDTNYIVSNSPPAAMSLTGLFVPGLWMSSSLSHTALGCEFIPSCKVRPHWFLDGGKISKENLDMAEWAAL